MLGSGATAAESKALLCADTSGPAARALGRKAGAPSVNHAAGWRSAAERRRAIDRLVVRFGAAPTGRCVPFRE